MKKTSISIIAAALCTALLAGCGQQNAQTSATAAETADTTAAVAAETTAAAVTDVAADTSVKTGETSYKILVTNILGSPVTGAKVQFCSANECMFAKTNSDGIAVFEVPEASDYEVHLSKVPEGYEKDETIYKVPEKYGTVEIVLQIEGSVEETMEKVNDRNVLNIQNCGVTFDAKGVYRDVKGYIMPLESGCILGNEPYIWFINLGYWEYGYDEIADVISYINDEYMPAYLNGEPIPKAENAEWENWKNKFADLFYIFAIGCGKGADELKDELSNIFDDPIEPEEIGKVGDVTYYIALLPKYSTEKYDALEQYMKPECFEEYKNLIDNKQDFIDSITLSEPEYPEHKSIGDTICFEAKDTDGNTVNSADLFKNAKVTMINLWSTICAPCKNELPELEEMSKEYAEQGVQIIGVCYDANSSKKIELAKQIYAKAGCTITDLVSFEGIDKVLPNTCTPTTFFVDSEGKLLVYPVEGAYIAKYKTVIAECLDIVG
jgi:AhpC/TSA family./Cna protein B-type domain.